VHLTYQSELVEKGAGESLVLCMEEMYGVVGIGVEEGQGDCGDDDDEAESETVPSFWKHFVCLSQLESSCMLMTSQKETKQTSLILKNYSV
jgi:hypothetical protein